MPNISLYENGRNHPFNSYESEVIPKVGDFIEVTDTYQKTYSMDPVYYEVVKVVHSLGDMCHEGTVKYTALKNIKLMCLKVTM